MRSYNIQYSNEEELVVYIDWLKKENRTWSDILVTVFSGNLDPDFNRGILQLIENGLPESKIIGCTTAGEIFNNEVLKYQIVISFYFFQSTSILTSFVPFRSEKDMAGDIENELIRDDTKGLLLFSIIIQKEIDHDLLLKNIYKNNPSIPVFGAGAGDNMEFETQYVFLGTQVTTLRMVAASFQSKELKISTEHSFNWRPVGNDFVVTKVDGSVLREIDYRPALDVFAENMGEVAVDGLPQSGLEFPMVFKEEDILVGRIIVAIDGKNLVMSAPIKKSSHFQFSFGIPKNAIAHSRSIYQKNKEKNIEAIMAFSCIARLNFLQSDAHKELVDFHLKAPVSGFFSYGEFYHDSDKNNYFLNETLTLAFFTEDSAKSTPESKRVKKKNSNPDDEDRILKVLTHLIDKVTNELEVKNKELNNAYSVLLDYSQIIDDKNFEIKKSLRYAGSLQQLIMPDKTEFEKTFDDYFVLYQPKEIVSGDFYFIRAIREKTIVAVADGTGHGVPGAFISILGLRLMDEIAEKMEKENLDIDASGFLNILRDKIKTIFQRNTMNQYSSDGLDISLVIIDKQRKSLDFSSANQSAMICSNDIITQLKGDRMPIGSYVREEDFSNTRVSFKPGDCLLLYTDGYNDQFGGGNDKKINPSRFRKIVKENSEMNFSKLETILDEYLTEWKGDNEQTDDVLIIGIKF